MKPRPVPCDLGTVPGAPGKGVRLALLADLPDNTSRVFTFTEGTKRFEMFLHRQGDEIFAYENSCPHQFLPLDWRPGRFLSAAGDAFVCSSHGARFRIEDGFCTAGPCAGAFLRLVAVQVKNGEILVA